MFHVWASSKFLGFISQYYEPHIVAVAGALFDCVYGISLALFTAIVIALAMRASVFVLKKMAQPVGYSINMLFNLFGLVCIGSLALVLLVLTALLVAPLVEHETAVLVPLEEFASFLHRFNLTYSPGVA